jgi:hypothetical protein
MIDLAIKAVIHKFDAVVSRFELLIREADQVLSPFVNTQGMVYFSTPRAILSPSPSYETLQVRYRPRPCPKSGESTIKSKNSTVDPDNSDIYQHHRQQYA